MFLMLHIAELVNFSGGGARHGMLPITSSFAADDDVIPCASCSTQLLCIRITSAPTFSTLTDGMQLVMVNGHFLALAGLLIEISEKFPKKAFSGDHLKTNELGILRLLSEMEGFLDRLPRQISKQLSLSKWLFFLKLLRMSE